ncbi:MAG: hypothetical protein FJ098_15765, partial [Deltaproteobacteria bacterium]|nr:hypothetical protein [Deltaproteobacteria bacterium]
MRDPRFRIIGLALFLGSCGGPDAGPDAAPAPDALRETALDAVADVLPDRGPAADTVDAVPDGAPETAADTLVIPPVPGAWCSPDGWCLERPTIPTLTIHAIGGVDSSPFFFQDKEDDVWFAGELGVMLHWDPSEPVGTGGTFQQVGPGRTLGDL